jgi:hypothetical protein
MNKSYKRKVRSYYKRFGLFAWPELAKVEPITEEEFYSVLAALKWEAKYKKGKSGLLKYGRYPLIKSLLSKWNHLGDMEALVKAQALRNRITEPYLLAVKYGKEKKTWYLNPYINYKHIQDLAALSNQCKSVAEFVERANEEMRYNYDWQPITV